MINDSFRPTWVEVDIEVVKQNIKNIKNYIGNVKYLLPVKSNAYGHGIINIGRAAAEAGVDYLGVATADEGIELRTSGIRLPILILGMSLPVQIDVIATYELIPTVCDSNFLDAYNKSGVKKNIKRPIHIKIDTGMGRIGVIAKDALSFIEYAASLPHITIDGVFTHFASSDEDAQYTKYQYSIFENIVKSVREKNIKVSLFHVANSGGVLNLEKEKLLDMVRPGILSYGYYPSTDLKENFPRVESAMSVKTAVLYVKALDKGNAIGYGATFKTKRKSVIATVPIGYGDGLMRRASNKIEMLLHGMRVPLIGRVSMDQVTIDATDVVANGYEVKQGDEVIVMGRQGSEHIDANELARCLDTIPYEIICMFGSRFIRRMPVLSRSLAKVVY